jgi:hypothetical protein
LSGYLAVQPVKAAQKTLNVSLGGQPGGTPGRRPRPDVAARVR